MENKKTNYERIAKIVGIIIGLILVFGISYAVFKTVTRSEESNTISAGKLDVQIENEQDEILLENSYPITEEEGLKQAPYTFDIVNKGSINAEYDLYIEIEENTTLPTEVVRYYLTVEEEGQEKIVTEKARIITQEETKEREGKTLYKIDTKYIDTTKTNKYKLYLWIDYEATKEEASNKYFEAKVVVDSVQIYDKNRLVKQVDVSESRDGSIQAYMYADGTVYIKGNGTIASDLSNTIGYEKEGVVDNYKKLLIEAGCNEEEVNAITSIEEFDEYTNNFTEEEWNNFYVVMYKETIEEMGYDASNLIDLEDSFYAWAIEQGFVDEEGDTTEAGEIFLEEFELRINEKYSTDPIPATKIVLEDGIENIPNGLYTGNEAITEVRIPASVVSIDARAFYGCTGLKEVVIPNSVTSIGTSAFYNCTSLTNVKLSNSITSIGNYVFSNCSSLTEIEIPNSVTNIESSAFQNCSSLTQINVDENNKNYSSIDGVLYNKAETTLILCPTGREELIMPDNLINIESNALTYSNIQKLTMNGTNKVMYNNLGLSKLKDLTLTGNGSIHPDYYYYADSRNPLYSSFQSLETVTFQDSVTSVSWFPFLRCINLLEINVSESNLNYSSYDGILYNKQGTRIMGFPKGKQSIRFPNTLITIENRAFEGNTNLVSVEIPESITLIGYMAFAGCTNLQEVNVSEDNLNYSSHDGVLYNKQGTTLFLCPIGKEEVNILKTTTTIGENAFGGCKNLTKIEIPQSVTKISYQAFADCINVDSITIPNSVTVLQTRSFSGWGSSQVINIDNTEEFINTNSESGWNQNCSAQINYLRS